VKTHKLVPRILVAFAALAFVASPSAAWAAPGDPDSSFSGDGFATVDFPGGQVDQAETILVQTNGRIVLGGESGPSGADDFALIRLRADGTPDTSFSGDGFTTFDFRGVGGRDEIWDLVQQPDGKIVAAGWAEDGAGAASRFAIARFRVNGTLDTSFSGDGKLLVKFRGYDSSFGSTLALQDDGKILVGGGTGDDASIDWKWALVRLKTDGSIDKAYGGGDGRVLTDFAANDDGIADMLLQPDGRLVAGGWSVNAAGGNTRSAFARYRSSGALDRSFSGDGKKVIDVSTDANDELEGLEIRPDGKIVGVVGVGDTPIALVRLTSHGAGDTSFSGDGELIVDPYPGGLGDADLDLAAGNKLVVTVGTFDNMIFLARFKPNGDLDTGFGGGDGFIVTTFPGATQSRVFSSAIQANGRILVAGFAQLATDDFGAARFMP
jgi:uncharacterized delta-60 repeat protein